MATLSDESQQINADTGSINKVIAPNVYWQVTFSQELKQRIDQPMNNIDKAQLYASLPHSVLMAAKQYQLIPTIIAKIEAPLSEHLLARLEKSETPHINHGDEMHVFLQGSGIFGFKCNSKVVNMEVTAGDVIYIDKDTEHSFRLGSEQRLMLASFHEDEFEIFHQRVEYITDS